MAHRDLGLHFTANSFIGDTNGANAIVASDLPALRNTYLGRPVLGFPDGADEHSGISHPFVMPKGSAGYTGNTLKTTLQTFAGVNVDDAANNTVRWEVYLEAYTVGTDEDDMTTSKGWAAANAGTQTFAASSGQDNAPEEIDITVTNDDGVVVGDLCRLGVRRDSDDGSNDLAAVTAFLQEAELWEEN